MPPLGLSECMLTNTPCNDEDVFGVPDLVGWNIAVHWCSRFMRPNRGYGWRCCFIYENDRNE